jgi:hypothetical protein
MKQLYRVLVLALCASGISSAANGQTPMPWDIVIHVLPVPLIGQHTNVWCWAASGQMVMKYFGQDVPQCGQATYQFGQAANVDCCHSPTPAACVHGGQVEIGHYGFTYNQLGNTASLTATQVENQIKTRKRPWIMNPHGPGKFGHVTVAVGYVTLNKAVVLIAVNDPWPVNIGDFYFELYGAYQCGFWGGTCRTEGYDLYDIAPPSLAIAEVPPPLLIQLSAVLPPPVERQFEQGASDPQEAATAAWTVLRTLVTRETATKLGFASPGDVEKVRLGQPVEQYNISLERLRAWKPGGRASDLLERKEVLLVPIEASGAAQASIRLRHERNVWKLATFGSPQLSKAWQSARASGAQFLVEIEALELVFGGRRVDGRLQLTPLFSDDQLQVRAGREEAAEKVLDRLVDAAKNHRGNVLAPR